MPEVGPVGTGVIVAVTAAVTVFVVRATFLPEKPVRALLVLLMSAGLLFESVGEFILNGGDWVPAAPLALCDFSVYVAVIALLTSNRLMSELTYLWGASGAFLAIVTPDLPAHRDLLVTSGFYVKHCALVVAAVGVAFRFGMPPRTGAVWRSFLCLNVVVFSIAVLDYFSGANFLFLRHKPAAATPFDYFGPWPYYILVVEALSVGFYTLLYLPFWLKRRRA